MSDFLGYLVDPFLWNGLWVAIQITVVSMVLALILGLVLALMRESRLAVVRIPAALYTWLMRGTPLLLQLVFLYTALPTVGIRMGPLVTAIIGFTLTRRRSRARSSVAASGRSTRPRSWLQLTRHGARSSR
jgi:polar amino acid transport system permease protein